MLRSYVVAIVLLLTACRYSSHPTVTPPTPGSQIANSTKGAEEGRAKVVIIMVKGEWTVKTAAKDSKSQAAKVLRVQGCNCRLKCPDDRDCVCCAPTVAVDRDGVQHIQEGKYVVWKGGLAEGATVTVDGKEVSEITLRPGEIRKISITHREGTTGGGGDPCYPPKCKCANGTCDEKCCVK